MIDPTIPVRIFSNIADPGNALDRRGLNCVVLWFLIRGLDSSGSGWAVISKTEAQEFLEISKPTFKRYWKTCFSRGFFRGLDLCENNPDWVKVYYSSAENVGTALGLEDLGTVTSREEKDRKKPVVLGDLKHKLKYIATQLQAQRSQNSSVHQAKRHSKGVLEPSALLFASPSSESQGVRTTRKGKKVLAGKEDRIIRRGKRFTFVTWNTPLVGVSQKTIAKAMGRNERTVRRRLSNTYRFDRGIPRIKKTQIAKYNKDAQAFLEAGGTHPRVFSVQGEAVISYCNIYKDEYSVSSARTLRRRFNLTKQKYLQKQKLEELGLSNKGQF